MLNPATFSFFFRVRLFSTKTFKPLGTLSFHAKSCQSLAFASAPLECELNSEGNDDDIDRDEMIRRSRWLAEGSQDNRISLWELKDFEKKKI